MLLQTGEDILAEGNRFEGNLTALFLDGALRDTFRNNLIAGNGTGIDLLASAEQNVFTENVFRTIGPRCASCSAAAITRGAWTVAATTGAIPRCSIWTVTA